MKLKKTPELIGYEARALRHTILRKLKIRIDLIRYFT